jgi:hypothetical protein
LIVAFFVDSRVVRVVERGENAVFDKRANPKVTKGFAECLLVISLVSGEAPQIARWNASDLLTEIGVASFPSRRAVNVKDGLGVCIDEFRDFQLLDAVTRSIAVVAARS